MTKDEVIKLTNQVFNHFQQITQWTPNDLKLAAEYETKAETLLTVIEEDLFGINRSRFKRGEVHKYETCGNKLYDRFWYIIKEEDIEKDIEKVCYFDVKDMYAYFRLLSNLRESFNR
jgi:hypothetical protein